MFFVLFFEEVAFMVDIDKPLPEFLDVFDEILGVIFIELSEIGHFKGEKSIRSRLVFFELLLSFGPHPHIFPNLLDVVLQFESIFSFVEILRVGVSETE